MFEVVNGETGESDGYFRSYVAAVEFGLTGEPGTLFEVWQVADDAARTRVLLHGRHRIPDAV